MGKSMTTGVKSLSYRPWSHRMQRENLEEPDGGMMRKSERISAVIN